MPARSSDEIRAAFIQFWWEEPRTSHLQPSSSLIPYDDPTVLLTTAGMQQFVPYLLGKKRAPHPRYVSVQKCFRTSDIDEVGDRSHLTFFEMLGNFSIGDYFKKEAIPWALEFSEKHLGFERERLWITIHTSDDEANQIWLEAGIPQERIFRFGDEYNWWGPPGTSGPCGPNSELYYAQGPGFGCGFPEDPPGCDCGRLEYWNLVFMQYNQDEHGVRTLLPKQNVDTGMGIERASVITQGVQSIYDTDLFQPIIQAASDLAGVTYGLKPETDYALRVLTDHARGMTFLVLDGVVPGTGGREYVLRRLVRRAIRYGRRLGVEQPFVVQLADAVIQRMRAYYPELETDRVRIEQVLANEEELFARTLRSGSAQIERLIAETKAAGQQEVPGKVVFDLYQTYGFPPELTEEMLSEEGLRFDQAGFDRALEEVRNLTVFAGTGRATVEVLAPEVVSETKSLAWTDVQAEARVQWLGARGDKTVLILDASPFYPEGGGQIGDTGWIRTQSGLFVVEDTKSDPAGRIVHIGRLSEGSLEPGQLAKAEVDRDKRERSQRHHTATHLLHRALKDVLGEATSQQGSYVGPDQLRFDFNHPRPVTREQLDDVWKIINERGMEDLPVDWQIMPIDQARQMGAVMMFGEKYGEQVRVVSIGDYSRELCGGTHTHHSGELGSVVIAGESGIGSGKRRIVAYAGQPALELLTHRLRTLEQIGQRVGAPTLDDTPARIDALLAELEATRREVHRLQQQQAHAAGAQLAARARVVHGVKVVAEAISNTDPAMLEQLADAVRDELRSGVVVLGTAQNGKVQFVATVTRDLTERIHAGALIGEVASQASGRGGSKFPNFAKGSGTEPAKLGAALQHTFNVVERTLASTS